jgi:O-acetyl-ADP-ribose deacetylase (regulator of RNase III)
MSPPFPANQAPGFRQVREVGLCAYNALVEADRLAREDAVRSILIPMLGTGVAGGAVEATATELVDAAIDYLVATPVTRLRTILFLGHSEAECSALNRGLRRNSAVTPVAEPG